MKITGNNHVLLEAPSISGRILWFRLCASHWETYRAGLRKPARSRETWGLSSGSSLLVSAMLELNYLWAIIWAQGLHGNGWSWIMKVRAYRCIRSLAICAIDPWQRRKMHRRNIKYGSRREGATIFHMRTFRWPESWG